MADPDDEKAGPQIVPDTPGDDSPSPTEEQKGPGDNTGNEGTSEELPSR